MTLGSRPQLRKPLERSRKGKEPKKGTLGGPGGLFALFLRNILPVKKRRRRKRMRKETSSILVVCCGLSQTGLECVAYLQKNGCILHQAKKMISSQTRLQFPACTFVSKFRSCSGGAPNIMADLRVSTPNSYASTLGEIPLPLLLDIFSNLTSTRSGS